MSQLTGYWKIISPKTRKEFYTTLATDAYDPRATDSMSMTSINWYSQVMRGPGTRMASYRQFDAMDADIDIARSLDIIAEEMSNRDDKTGLPFVIEWQKEDNQDVSDAAVVTVRAALRQWSELQQLHKRVFSIARAMIKYGDCFFRKTSDTRRWEYIDPQNIEGIEIDEFGNKVAYHVKKLNPMANYANNNREQKEIIPAAGILHFSMCDEMGDSAPFGSSVLRPIYRVYRQLSMLEDAVIIYRIVRAPERRVFYIDVGNMNQQQIRRYLEQVKSEQRQKRIPNATTNGQRDIVDGQYDAQSISEDMFFPVTASGRSSRVEVLPGGTEDFGTTLLKHFQEKIFRGLRIPTSYLSGTDAQGTGGAQSNDGKVGIAYIEELRFAKFIQRLQYRLNQLFDEQFKIYLKVADLQIDDEAFQIRLPDPANFALYRQAALDADLIASFKNVEDSKLLSKRFVLKRYLGLTDDELQMNEALRKEEQNIEDTPEVSAIQQLYDPSVYDNRGAIKLKGDEENASGEGDFGGDGLGGDVDVSGSGESDFGGEAPTDEEPSGAPGLPSDAELAQNFSPAEEEPAETGAEPPAQ